MTSALLATVLMILSLSFWANADYGGSVFGYGYEFAFYHSNGDKIDYIGALIRCETGILKGWLAEPKTPEINNLLQQVTYGSYSVWIGATDLSAEHRWLWLDTTELYWTNWDAGEPNNSADEDCMLFLASGEWNDKSCCYRAQGYICQIPDSARSKFGHSELNIVKTPATFKEATDACSAQGARLVSTTDEASERDLRQIVEVGNSQLWVGKMENGLSGCALFNRYGTFADDCSKSKEGFICETVRPHALRVSQRNASVIETSAIEVDCTGEGYPIPDMEWRKDGKIVAQVKSLGKSTLVVNNAKKSDAGQYTCYATNAVNKDKYEARTFMDLEVTARN